ncbi:hypothetical protein [Pseudobacillus badius]|uniref:hypothetical protein n=1 Tax=Bacillus badius TaxID=1455 RepID=UPI0005978959|nr:hypothetical protein [Bacillus badius]KIL71968.1 hypothetical protein SD78_1273 [Bacillus badius]KZN99338.1 hypothetical protein A4244_18620 [Bacillus badius]TDW00883.1 RelA/SpoT family protein [Bacillus badius]UAT29918.1 hypothetical protein K7T73_15325 [Bacillus badius]
MENSVLDIIKQDEYRSLDYSIDTVGTLIHEVIKLHKQFSEKFIELNGALCLNFKKTLVRDVVEQVDDSDTFVINQEFHSLLNTYLRKIDQLIIDIDLEYTYNKFDFRLRVKQLESIIYKLCHYNSGKEESGRLPLNKCLNDLLGFRIMMPGFQHGCESFSKMCQHIEKFYKIKYRNSSKGDYKATHVYFYGGSNKNFPWELQIWLPEDYMGNYESHAKHKQEYIKSAKIHKQALRSQGGV